MTSSSRSSLSTRGCKALVVVAASLGLASTLLTGISPANAAPIPQSAPIVATTSVAPEVSALQTTNSGSMVFGRSLSADTLSVASAAAPLYPCNRPKMRKIKSKSGGGLKTTIYIEQYNRDHKLICTIVSKVGKTSDSSKLHIKYGSSKKSKQAKVFWRTKKLPSGLCIKVEGSRQTTKHKWEICYG